MIFFAVVLIPTVKKRYLGSPEKKKQILKLSRGIKKTHARLLARKEEKDSSARLD